MYQILLASDWKSHMWWIARVAYHNGVKFLDKVVIIHIFDAHEMWNENYFEYIPEVKENASVDGQWYYHQT